MRVEIVIEEGDVTVSGPRKADSTPRARPGEEPLPAASDVPTVPSEVVAAASATGAFNAGPAPTAPRGTTAPTINIGASSEPLAAMDGLGVGDIPAGGAPSSMDLPAEVVSEEGGASLPDEDQEE